LRGETLALGFRRRVFIVKLGGKYRRPAAVCEPSDGQPMVEGTLPDAQPISDLHRLGPFGTSTVHLYLASIDGLGRERPRLEEAGGPEPRVEAH